MKIEKSTEVKLSDGKILSLEQNLLNLTDALKSNNRNNLPFFWDLSKALGNYSNIFLNFYIYLIANNKLSQSQLYQDLFVLFILNEKKDGVFLEFGATDGKSLSNSYLLENQFDWQGVLIEPSPQWHEKLKNNRPNSTVIEKCIYSETGKVLDFFVSDKGAYSTIDKFKESDLLSMPGNTKARIQNGYNTKVNSISLNDVFIKYFNSSRIDYMSVDTEGSEYEILKNFDFKSFGPKIVTVEHNFTEEGQRIDELFFQNGYVRYFKEHTQFDAWYVLQT